MAGAPSTSPAGRSRPPGADVGIKFAEHAHHPVTGAATLDMNGHHVSVYGLVTTSGLTDLNFANPATGNDLLTIGSGGLTVAPGTGHQLRHDPTVAGNYAVDSS